MTTDRQLLTAAEAACALDDLSERRGFRVARVNGNVVRLRTPAAALNAADWLCARGIAVRAERVGSQWAVVA